MDILGDSGNNQVVCAERKTTKKKSDEAGVRGTKREAILDAALDLVVEGGFHGAPMSAIGRRARASAGVIYHHFESKEEIFQAVYERARHLKRASLLDGYTPLMDAKEGFILVALNAYTFYRRHHKALRFVHLYEDAGFPIPEIALRPPSEVIQFQQRYRAQSQGGVLADLPSYVLDEMSLGLIARLAGNGKKLTADVVREIAERVWDSLKA
jgi:TetR/AcrR family transcriptional regulator, repressor of fatR-cypB operon